jgi:heme O synthase-like polyprenyltransferase
VAARPILIISNPPAATGKPQRAVSRYAAVSDYWALTKPEVNVLIAVATFTGFYLGHATQSQSFPFLLLINTLLGTLLVASGTGTLNQYIERRFDAQMRRTARRPLAAGRLKNFRRSVVRGGSVDGWQHLSCDNRQCICECARDCHLAVLFVSLHSA